MTEKENPLVLFSNAMADAVTSAGSAVVLVNARKRLPASGVVFENNLALNL